MIVIDVGHSDTDDTSVLHVPELEPAVAGDVVYNGVPQFLVESGHGGRYCPFLAGPECFFVEGFSEVA